MAINEELLKPKKTITVAEIKKIAGTTSLFLFCILLAVVIIAPIFLMFKISISQPQDILTQHPSFMIKHFTIDHWKRVLSSGMIVLRPFQKSIFVATFTAILAMLIAVPGAYVISRFPRKIKYATIFGLFFTRMFPEVGIALPIAVTFIRMGLLDTNLGLILAHLIKVLPFFAWILVGTFDTIPRDLEEAAAVDGCSRIKTLTNIVFPMAGTGIAAGIILSWLDSWNEFTYALYMCLTEPSLPLKTYYYINRGNWFDSAAYSIIIAIPVLLLTYFLQKYMRNDYLSGAIKG